MPAPITLYSTPWCGYCHRLKGQLARAGIAFVEVDNPSAFKFFPAIGWCHEGIEDGMHRFCREM